MEPKFYDKKNIYYNENNFAVVLKQTKYFKYKIDNKIIIKTINKYKNK